MGSFPETQINPEFVSIKRRYTSAENAIIIIIENKRDMPITRMVENLVLPASS